MGELCLSAVGVYCFYYYMMMILTVSVFGLAPCGTLWMHGGYCDLTALWNSHMLEANSTHRWTRVVGVRACFAGQHSTERHQSFV
jgi:hypothetical protein